MRLGHHLHRFVRRLLGRFHAPRMTLVYNGGYTLALPGQQVDPHRAANILTFLAREALIRRGDLRWPRPASASTLCRVHSPDYLEEITAPGALTQVIGFALDPREEDQFLDSQRLMVGGTVLSTRLALSGCRPVVNLGGGLHHAHRDRGRGFCAFNDVAVAIAQARESGFDQPILVVDLDIHDGDGTRALFADDESVYTFSVHNQHWDEQPAVAATSVALGDGVEDDEYLAAVGERLPPVIAEHRPGLVYYLAGCDPAAGDRIGNWRISADGMLARDRLVIESLQRQVGEVPIVILLAGGYGSESWRYSARFFAWLLTGGLKGGGVRIDPPSTDEVTIYRYRQLAGLLQPAELTSSPSEKGGWEEADWGLSDEDIFGDLGQVPAQSRFLGYYSRHGLEIALERYGYFTQLRRLGFERPTIELDLDNPAGQTLRIFAGEAQQEVLTELRMRRDRGSLPGYELLFVEWMMLQNPRARFASDRPRLPGQDHPGLGLLRDTIALLIMTCNRLDLDGLAFVPSHYHLAAQSARYLRFLHPADEARFRAIRQLFAGRPLAEATRAVAGGKVRDRATGETVTWKPAPMVLPVSDKLKERVDSEDYERRVEEALAGYELAVAGASG